MAPATRLLFRLRASSPRRIELDQPCYSRTLVQSRQRFAPTDPNTFSQCKARGCPTGATLITEKVDGAGRHLRQIELCLAHYKIVIDRERARGLENFVIAVTNSVGICYLLSARRGRGASLFALCLPRIHLLARRRSLRSSIQLPISVKIFRMVFMFPPQKMGRTTERGRSDLPV